MTRRPTSATYRDMYFKAEEELKSLKDAVSPVERLLSHSCLVDALLAVVSRNGLLDEFAKELSMREARLWNKGEEPARNGGGS